MSVHYPKCSITPELSEDDIGKALSLCMEDRCLKHVTPVDPDDVLAWVSDVDGHHNNSGVALVQRGLVQCLPVSESIEPGADVRINAEIAAMQASGDGPVVGLVTDVRWRFNPVLGQGGRVEDYAIPGTTAWTHVFNAHTTERACTLFARHRQGWGGYKVEVGHRRAVVNDTDDYVSVYEAIRIHSQLVGSVEPRGRAAWTWDGLQWKALDTLLRVADVMLL